MKFSKYTLLLLYALFGCSSVIQLPKRQVAEPSEKNIYLGNHYANQEELSNQGTWGTLPIYFNYEDFRDYDPVGGIIAETPYDTIKDLKSIPPSKLGLYHELDVDSSTVEFLSNLLVKAKKAKLNQEYTGRETYRFILTRAFDDDYIIELYKDGSKATIETTKIDNKTGKINVTTKIISLMQFQRFQRLLIDGNFWAIRPYEWVAQVDGSKWTIEAHTPLAYKVLSRSSPGLIYEDELLLRQAGEWLINKGGGDFGL